jgi:hypothetical protein
VSTSLPVRKRVSSVSRWISASKAVSSNASGAGERSSAKARAYCATCPGPPPATCSNAQPLVERPDGLAPVLVPDPRGAAEQVQARTLALTAVFAGLAGQLGIVTWAGAILLGLSLWIGFPGPDPFRLGALGKRLQVDRFHPRRRLAGETALRRHRC